ncbi:hypothetical protein [Streptomyces sp. NPDC048266]
MPGSGSGDRRVLLRLVNAPGGAVDVDAADLVDIPPARHRRGGLWFA